jgi:hypothetical protein
VSDIVDGENGCVEPESNDGGDTSCGVNDGELSDSLQLTVTRTDGPDAGQLWSGPFSAMTVPTLLADVMPAGAQWSLRVDVLVRPETGNAAMTDAVEFTMGWSARAEQVEPPGGVPQEPGAGSIPGGEILGEQELADDVQVAGVAGSRPGGEVLGAEGFALPLIGTTVEPWLLVYTGVLLGGGALLIVRAQRQPNPAPRHRAGT